MEMLYKATLTLMYLGGILSLVSLPLSLALRDSGVGPVLMGVGGFMMTYSFILFLFCLSLEGLRETFGRLSFIAKLTLSIAAFGLGLLLASPLSLLLFIFLQLDTAQMIGIGILAASGFSLLIAFLLFMIHTLVNLWRDRL